MLTTVLPVLLFAAFAVLLALAMLFVGRVFGPRRQTAVKQMPYESGMDPIHDARRRFDVRFHLVAIAFLVFDVELLFLYPWAVASHPWVEASNPVIAAATAADSEPAISVLNPKSVAQKIANPNYFSGIDAAVHQGLVSSRGLVFAEAMVFIALLAAGYLYAWRKGVFRWH